ncbi:MULTISPECIES: sensor histidine kinase [Rhodococcus]|uniref:sensor histidine kinase n=1 Tax=Rhodococcus TaxID=1827 RepID=UPI001E3A8D40|nr:HAMP domain-containing sensor histidine kinase [Rhodococcus pyridinivorans]MCD2118693.1 HAMP domain-containing histidine kinase [Rhodococcus pyridinivorans]MCZ4627564.1 HAMP domain-containing sensor histidine kinase [Rhodococcus pyridinivorans]MCZ4648670.1 HAMP domain-containing sensor histidine kinase [Rhodococcus pyridinivorans]MDJ0481221.1 HAMP domain-containing sensor histidine kinase [Rhodococcus pyridinivorans]MDV7254860.1 HAMP domain-containing sensor histidine kinase [Rhodococcus py
MHRRVLAVLLVFATVAVVAFAVPLALATSAGRTAVLGANREADAHHFATLAVQTRAPDSTALLDEEVTRYHRLYDEGVLIVDARGAPRASAGLTPTDPGVPEAITAGLRNQKQGIGGPLTPWSPHRVLLAVPVGTGAQVEGAVVVDVSTDAARHDIRTSWLLIVTGAAAALVLVTILATVLSRWTVRPLTALTARVAALTDSVPALHPRSRTGDTTVSVRYHGPPEVRELTQAFDTMSEAVRTSTRAQKQLIADTAHQLRNPLAALHIRLDSLEPHVAAAGAETYRRTAVEVDRLGGILDGLLALATAESPTDTAGTEGHDGCDVGAVVADRVDAWSEALAEAGMTVTVDEPTGPRLHACFSADHLAQVLDVLLSNASKYARAATGVRITTRHHDGTIRIRVEDDGAGVAPDELGALTSRFFRGSGADGPGTGLGLSIAVALVETGGGTLDLAAADPHGLAVTLTLPADSRAEAS